MAERTSYAPGTPNWVDVQTTDTNAAKQFYGSLFGWTFVDNPIDEANGVYYSIATIRDRDVAAVAPLGEQAAAGIPPHWNSYISVDDVDGVTGKVESAGGTVMAPPFDVMDAGRMAVLADPEGAVFCVWQAKEHRGARIVNEPGAVNFNVLNTRDPEAAKRFYGTVFGWTTLDLGSGEFWTLRAYGDYLEELTPGTRQRSAELGAAGFENVVAALTPLAPDAADTPAHWSVTFGTADADATAAKAAELGGAVLVAPVDAPYSRLTVIRDPQGATFSATAFVPENKDVGRAGP